jgi:hypothetical protein
MGGLAGATIQPRAIYTLAQITSFVNRTNMLWDYMKKIDEYYFQFLEGFERIRQINIEVPHFYLASSIAARSP